MSTMEDNVHPYRCWIKGWNDVKKYGWSWLGLCRLGWIGGGHSWLLYLGRKTIRITK